MSTEQGDPAGRFLVMEGIDGSGKSTQVDHLRRWLPASGLMPPGADLVVTREPGGTDLGQRLRAILLDPQVDVPPLSELMLFAADRTHHVATVVRPALERGAWVLSDRFCGSTVAYQGHGRGLDRALIQQLETIATGGLTADLTLWLDLPLEQVHGRQALCLEDRIEDGGQAFLERVQRGFAAVARERGWQRIAADASCEQVSAAIEAACRGGLAVAR